SLADPPGAVVLVTLRADRVGYAGVWTADAFPGRSARLGPIPDLVATWRDALERLVDEYAAGDVRIFAPEAKAAAGAFAPLTRVYEQLALAARADVGREGAQPGATSTSASARSIRRNRSSSRRRRARERPSS